MHSMEENENRNESEAEATLPPDAAFDVPATGEARGHGPGFLFGVLMGALVGAGLATIFAPVSGEEARVRTAEKAPELWRRREELARGAIGGARSRLDEALEAAREATRESQREARRRYERMTGRGSGPPLP
jgi:gas vesicle protein